MPQPNLFLIPAFDAMFSKTIGFSFSGNQAIKNELVLRNNETNEIVYQEIQTTLILQHIVPENILQNGTMYNAQVRVYDSSDTASLWSNIISFYCFTTPVFVFENLVENQIIKNSSFEFIINYSQIENEPLNTYRIVVYKDQVEKFNSGIRYSDDILSVSINGLEDNTKYQIEAIGETLHGIALNTGIIDFSVDYIEPSIFAMVDLENLCETGEIRIQSNIKSIVGISNPDPPEYSDSKVILTDSGSWVEFDEGFSINNDFTLQILGENFTEYATVLLLFNAKYKIELKYMLGTFNNTDVAYFLLKVSNKITNYYLTSNYIAIPSENDPINIWLRKIGGLYNLVVFNVNE